MRKYLAIAFSTLYILATMGIMVSKHSCCGQVVGMHLSDSSESCCDHGEHQCTSKSEDCCSFDLMFFAVEDEHNATNINWSFNEYGSIPQIPVDRGFGPIESLKIQSPDSPDPPSAVPIYLKTCSLILYA